MFSSLGKAFTDLFSPTVKAQSHQNIRNKKHSRSEYTESFEEPQTKKQKIEYSTSHISEMNHSENDQRPQHPNDYKSFNLNNHFQQNNIHTPENEKTQTRTRIDPQTLQFNHQQNNISNSLLSSSQNLQSFQVTSTSWRNESDLQLSLPSSPRTLPNTTTTSTTTSSPNVDSTNYRNLSDKSNINESNLNSNTTPSSPPKLKVVSPIPTRGRFLSATSTTPSSKGSSEKRNSTDSSFQFASSSFSEPPTSPFPVVSQSTSPRASVTPIRPPFHRLSSPTSSLPQSTGLEEQILNSMYISPPSRKRAQSVLSEIERVEEELQEREYLEYLRGTDQSIEVPQSILFAKAQSPPSSFETREQSPNFTRNTSSFDDDRESVQDVDLTTESKRFQERLPQFHSGGSSLFQRTSTLQRFSGQQQPHSILFGPESSQISTQQRPLLRTSSLDHYISTHFTSPSDTIQRSIPKYKEVDLWQLELENKTFRERHQQGLQILNHLRKLAEKYKGSEVEVNFERLAKAQVETLQKQQEQETKKQNEKKVSISTKEAHIQEEDEFRPLSNREEEQIKKSLKGASDDVVAEIANIRLERKDLKRLEFTEWLNDEVVNFYMELLNEKNKQQNTNGKRPKCYIFNSFFYTLLSNGGYNYSRVQKWTRKIDIFSMDKVLIPVHLGNHWCLAVINFVDKRFEYYDSLGGENPKCLERLRRYVKDEYRTKHRGEYDLSQWQDYTPLDIPHQQNGYDCGVFMCKFADYLSRGKPFDFSQSDMPYFRKRMILEILSKNLAKQNQNQS